MCLLDTVSENCGCIHPLYTDFDLFKKNLEATYEMQICNLVQESKCMAYYFLNQISQYLTLENMLKSIIPKIDKSMI